MEKAVELSTVSRHELVWHEAHAALSSNLLPSAKINGKDRNRHMYASRWYGVVILPDQAHSGFDTQNRPLHSCGQCWKGTQVSREGNERTEITTSDPGEGQGAEPGFTGSHNPAVSASPHQAVQTRVPESLRITNSSNSCICDSQRGREMIFHLDNS